MISSRHLDLTETLVSQVEQKVLRLRRLNAGIIRADVRFEEARNPRIAERETCAIDLEGLGSPVHAKATASDARAALDAALAKLEHQLGRLKTRAVSRAKGG